jgi:dienelactone hydrolase
MLHETLIPLALPLALIAFMLATRPVTAADRLVDGVPLPGEAKVATVVETDLAELRQWAGVWVGAWGGTLRHILLVESVTTDGQARVVYAVGDNPQFGIRRGWSRHEATQSKRRLTISEAGFSATYDLDDQGGLNATYTRGTIVSHAAMTKLDWAALTVPGAVVPWTPGQSGRLVDGVPLPGDAKVATVLQTNPAELRQWAGVWAGAWGQALRHILLVESINSDGSAQVVYAIGDNPPIGIQRAWSRHKASLSGRRLTISETGFSATYDLDDQGGLSATYTRGTIVAHAAMTKMGWAALTVPDAVVQWTSARSDRLVDGVPVPEDANVATLADTNPAELRKWAGVWVGAWGGTLKHILLVESVAADGSARVVYAIGDNPWFGIQRTWYRHNASLSGRRLTISESGFSATYDLDDQTSLNATYTRGGVVSRAAMTKLDWADLTAPNPVIPWTRGKSEHLRTALIEDGNPVDLEVVIFRPSGAGPFPLAMFNHGSTGRGNNPALFTETSFNVGLADFLNDQGWIVAFPQRRGRGKSDGLYDEGFSADRRQGYTCDFATSLSGADRALDDIAAAMTALEQRPDVAASRVLIGGASRGGILSVAYAGMHPEQIFGVMNFVGGWVGTGCATADRLNGTLFERGARFARPTLWLYGDQDPHYDLQHSRKNFSAFQRAGGQGTFLEFEVPGGNGHFLLNAPELWQGPLAEYLRSLADDANK